MRLTQNSQPLESLLSKGESDLIEMLEHLIELARIFAEILKACAGPVLALIFFTMVQEPWRAAQQSYKFYCDWLSVLPTEIKRLLVDCRATLEVWTKRETMKTGQGISGMFPPSLLNIVFNSKPDFLLDSRVHLLGFHRGLRLVPLINEVGEAYDELAFELKRYNDGVDENKRAEKPVWVQKTTSLTALRECEARLVKLLSEVKNEIEILPNHSPRIFRFWFRTDM
jgi:hypothetical protein